ncbi:MAG: hypothetical protein LBF89_08160 [Bacteroidales bacterium]|nr:hypothetical protein [Bacteroidales bacterium]
MKNNSSDLHYSAKARRHEGTNVEAKGFRLKNHPLWRMRNVLKGRNFHNRRSLTCGSALHSFFCLNRKLDAVKGSTCPAFDCVELTVQAAALLREASFPPVSDRRL